MRRTETATSADPTRPGEVVRRAGNAIAQAQAIVARLAEVLDLSRALRVRAQGLQDQALRFRYRDPRSPRQVPRPAKRRIDDE
jgi:hypothetical protein